MSEFDLPSSTLHKPGVSVFSLIGFQEFDAKEYREFVRTLSDEALIREGKKMRWLSGDGKIVTTTPSAFAEQLKISREEYRWRHPNVI
jgi:hypothetical protein